MRWNPVGGRVGDSIATAGRLIWRLGSGIWLGTLVFFSLSVTPTIFGVLGAQRAAPLIDRLFPAYYALALWSGGFALAGVLLLRMDYRARWRRWSVGCAALAYGLTWLAVGVLGQMRGAGRGYFSALHEVSVFLNLLEILALLAAMVSDALADAPAKVNLH